MHYELRIDHNGSPLRSKSNSSDVFPNNYALCITNYELTKESPYGWNTQQLCIIHYELRIDQWIAPTDGISQQLCIMNYELRIIPMDVFPNNYALCIMNYELF